MALPSKPTRIERTEQRYRRRTKNLVAQCRKKLEIANNETLDYRRFVGWLVTRKPEWSRDTWRQYKASVMFFLEQESERGDDIALEAMEFLFPVDVSGCLKKTKRTSASKQKKFPLKDFKSLIKNILDFGSPWAEDVERWIGSSLLTGLRPSEWANTKMTTKSNLPVLIVTNGKATNGRAHGPTRTIILDGLTDDERDMISAHVKRSNEWEQAQQFERFYNGCSATLARAGRRLWPKRDKHATLYSMRHQFAANAKASGYTREEIAALMGHAVDTTATAHYGKKTAGFDMLRVRPDPAEVARIRSVFKGRHQTPHPETVVKKRVLPKPKPPEEK